MSTVVAPITPMIESAVIGVRISGANASDALKLFYKGDKNLYTSSAGERAGGFGSIKAREAVFCRFKNNELEDDVVLIYYANPHSYTGEDVLEIFFHGNPLIVSSALVSLNKIGIRTAEPGEFTKRAFLNGKMDLSEAEAVIDIISAKSIYSVNQSYKKLHGAIQHEIEGLVSKIIDVLGVVEAYIDFPDEDIQQPHKSFIFDGMNTVVSSIANLLDTYDRLKFVNEGLTVAIAGKPNVGKSSLLNKMLMFDRAIVSEEAGTTRDFISETVLFEGIPVTIIDTAGIRDGESDIERQGIQLALNRFEKADIVFCLFDISQALNDDDKAILEKTEGKKRFLIGNKLDLTNKDNVANGEVSFNLLMSVKDEKSVQELFSLIKQYMVEQGFDKYGTQVLISANHKATFTDAMEKLIYVTKIFDSLELEIIAFELNEVKNILSSITGQNYTEDILGNIFSRFCLGK